MSSSDSITRVSSNSLEDCIIEEKPLYRTGNSIELPAGSHASDSLLAAPPSSGGTTRYSGARTSYSTQSTTDHKTSKIASPTPYMENDTRSSQMPPSRGRRPPHRSSKMDNHHRVAADHRTSRNSQGERDGSIRDFSGLLEKQNRGGGGPGMPSNHSVSEIGMGGQQTSGSPHLSTAGPPNHGNAKNRGQSGNFRNDGRQNPAGFRKSSYNVYHNTPPPPPPPPQAERNNSAIPSSQPPILMPPIAHGNQQRLRGSTSSNVYYTPTNQSVNSNITQSATASATTQNVTTDASREVLKTRSNTLPQTWASQKSDKSSNASPTPATITHSATSHYGLSQPAESCDSDGWGDDDDGFGGGVSMVDINQIKEKMQNLSLPRTSSQDSGCQISERSFGGEVKENHDIEIESIQSESSQTCQSELTKSNAESEVEKPLESLHLKTQESPSLGSCSKIEMTSSISSDVTETKATEQGVSVSTPDIPRPNTIWRPRKGLNQGDNVEREVKSLLNKLTIEKFPTLVEKLAVIVEQVADDRIQNVVNLVMEKAVTEPDWSEMYADLCQVLRWRRADSGPGSKKNSFLKVLLSKIQKEYMGMPKTLELSPEEMKGIDEYEQSIKITKMKNRILGIVKLIGELFQRRMLGCKTVNEVVVDLVFKDSEPHEHFIECFLQLIYTTGYYVDQVESSKAFLDTWFGRIQELQRKKVYSKRIKCVMQDVLDLRRTQWRKKIHKERAKALSDLRDQLEAEEVIGGASHAAQYGNIVVVGKRSNLSSSGAYAEYLTEQENRFKKKLGSI